MQKTKIQIGLAVMLLGCWLGLAGQTDTVRLGYGDYLGLVLQNHPVAKQAAVRGETGQQYVRVARGAFDPYLAATWDAKQFSGKDYWQLFQGSLRTPTWFGTEVYAGWNSATGSYVNPSDQLPAGGQAAIGVEVNLGRGLLIDQRRADLQKAKLYAQSTQMQQRIMVLDLIAVATESYWEWWLASHNKTTYQNALQLAELRHIAVVGSWQRGENPAIDTLEAYLQVQNRLLNLSEAEADWIKATANLSNHLWDPAGEPVEFAQVPFPARELPQNTRIQTLTPTLVDSLIAQHPDLLYYEYERGQLKIEEKWRKEQLKPELAVKYQALSAAPQQAAWLGNFAPADNLKWGLKFSYPLFLRKQRGYLALARLAIEQNSLAQDQKQLELRNKLAALSGTLAQTETQLRLAQEMVANYLALVEAENRRFELGESSIFLVNAREQKLVEAELKVNALQSKIPKLVADLNRATGGYLLPL